MNHASDITLLLRKISSGDSQAEEDLFSIVYADLHRMASALMRREGPGHTLQATALVHDAYLRMVDQKNVGWQDRGHFFAMAARVMRRVLVDHARRRMASKRGGGAAEIRLEEGLVWSEEQGPMIAALDEALTRLAERDERQAKVVEWRFFGGMDEDEIAGLLGISTRTVKREWAMARAWLYGELNR